MLESTSEMQISANFLQHGMPDRVICTLNIFVPRQSAICEGYLELYISDVHLGTNNYAMSFLYVFIDACKIIIL